METPPTYKPEQTEGKPQPTEPAGGSTNDAGTLNDMYENGNKIGIMGG